MQRETKIAENPLAGTAGGIHELFDSVALFFGCGPPLRHRRQQGVLGDWSANGGVDWRTVLSCFLRGLSRS